MDLIQRRRELLLMQNPLYEGFNLSFDKTANTVIDTGVYLFTQKNINRDFEFIAEGICGDFNSGENNTILCAKHDKNAYGFLVRTSGGNGTTYNGTIFVKKTPNVASIIVRRINGVISLTGENITNPTIKFSNNVFNWPLVLGCAIDDNGNWFRFASGTIQHVMVRWI